MKHDPDCRWELTTLAECEYRDTHHYCPHPEHACNCKVPADRVPSRVAELRRAIKAIDGPPEIVARLRALLDEYEAWDRTTDQRN